MACAALLAVAGCGERESGARDSGPEDDGGRLPEALEALLAQLADGVAGAPCMDVADCAGKNAMCSLGAPSAVRSCTGFCTEDEDCGAGGTCVETATWGTERLSFCQKVCASDAECSPELECRKGVDVNALGRSISELIVDGDVDWLDSEQTPNVCQEKVGAVQLEDGVVGSACDPADPAKGCGEGTCASDSPVSPGGYCTGTCTEDADCGATGACAFDFASSSFGLPGFCMLKCNAASDCREADGYRCEDSGWLLGEDSYCVPGRFERSGVSTRLP